MVFILLSFASGIAQTSQSFCGSATVTNLSTGTTVGSSYKWYSSDISPTALNSTTALATGNYYLEETFAPITLGSGFNKETSVAVDAAGTIYVSDQLNNAIKKMSPDGLTITTLKSGLSGPFGIALDAAGNVYVAESTNNAVKKISADGSTVTTLGGGFNRPCNVAVDAAGYIYVADQFNNAIKKISPDGVTTTTLAIGFNRPQGIALDAAGNIYVSDTNNNAIKKIAPDGSVKSLRTIGINNPIGLAIDAFGNIYEADYGTNSINKISPDGLTISTVRNDFNRPYGVFIDGSGNIFVADTNNSLVKKIVVTRNAVNVAVNPVPAAPTVSTPVVYTLGATASALTATNGTNLKWYTDATTSTSVSTITPLTSALGTTSYWVSQTVNGCESTRAKINVTVNPAVPNISYAGVKTTYITGTAIASLTPTNTGGTPEPNPTKTYTISPALPVGLYFDTTSGVISGTPTAPTASNTYTITTQNAGGVNNTKITFAISVPIVTSVDVPANKIYTVGNSQDFLVNFNGIITVTGTPQLEIAIGATTRQAIYMSGSGTSGLLFRYIVQSGELDDDGITIGTLVLNGGTLKDSGTNDADLLLNNVGETTAVLVDAVGPTASIVVADINLTIGKTSLVTFTFSEAVTGFTNADFTVESGTLSAVSSSDGGVTWTAYLTPTPNITDASNIITLNNAGITDLAGNAGNARTYSNNYAVDTAAPTASIEVADTNLKIGETSLVTFTFSEAVTGLTNAGFIVEGGTLGAVRSLDGGVTWTAYLTPTPNVADATNIITLFNTGVTDAAGNTGIGTTDSNNYAIDTAAPEIINLTVPVNGTYTTGNTLDFTVNFPESVFVSGTPQLAITIGATTRQVDYFSGSGSSSLTFRYIVQAGELDTDGIEIGTITLNGGALRDFATNDANLLLNNVGVTTAVLVDATISPTITFADISKIYGDADFDLTAISDSPGNISYSIIAGGTGSVILSGTNNKKVTLVNAGTVAIRATQVADRNYRSGLRDITLTIEKKSISVTADSQTKTYGSTDPALSYTSLPGLVGSDSFTGALSRTAGENVGSYAIRQGTLSAGSNYAISFTESDLAVTAKPIAVTADSQTKIYGSADPVLTYTFSTGLVGSDVFTGALSRTAGENVGSYAIGQGTLSAGSNYAISYTESNLAVTAKPISVTADSQTKIYGSADPVLTYTFSPGLVGSDSFTGALSRTAGENVGSYAIGQGTLSAGSNYAISFTESDLAVTAKPIAVTADSQTKIYGSADPVLTYTFSPGLVGSDSFTGALSRTAGENVGSYAIGQGTLSAGSNYAISYTESNLAVTVKPIAVTADSQTKIYGSADPVLTYTFSPGLVGSDSFTGALSRTAGENVGSYAIGQGTLSAGSNYAISYTESNLAVTAKPIAVTADSQTKIYGSADPVLTYTFSPGLVGSDVFTGALSRTAGENVGSYAIGQGTLSAGSNYAISFTESDLAVTAKPIAVTADSKTKIYGSADPVLTYTFSPGLVGSDAFTGALSRTAGENVGSYAIGQGTLNAGLNYAISYTESNLIVTAKAITVTADDFQTKVYGETDSTLTYSVSPALVRNDILSGTLKRAIGENVGTYEIGQGTLTAGNNYAITYIGKDFEITRANQVITWNQTLVSNCDGATSTVLTASSNSGLPISYVSSNIDVVTIFNNELIFKNSGSGTITASQAGNNNYYAAESITLPVLNSQPNLIRQQFDNVIFFDNSSKEFTSYAWYKDGILVAGQTLQYYKEAGGLNGTYYAVAKKLDGTLITSCPLKLSSTATNEVIKIIPNPVKSNETYQLVTNFDPAKMINSRVDVFSISGSLVDQKVTNENETTLLAPAVEGVYIVRLTLTNGKTFTKNLLVKN